MYAVEVENLSKKFRLTYDATKTLKERILFPNRSRRTDFWVLKKINFKIKRGSTVALIGENGSGKSTLLKLLTRIIYPESGNIIINGRVSSLLELGAGFHPDFTGKENIYINASIFGLTNRETDKIIDDIIAFSELEEFINLPVRTYSSGMYMRLAFSIAISVEPEVLLIDEILAVGDAAFQTKCFDKLFALKNKGVTIVFVSHDIGAVHKLCDTAIWLKDGEIEEQGNVEKVSTAYMKYMSMKTGQRYEEENETVEQTENNHETDSETENNNQWGNKKVEIYDFEVLNYENQKIATYVPGEKCRFKMKYKLNAKVDSCVFGIAIKRVDDLHCYGTNTEIDGVSVENLKTQGEVVIEFDNIPLLENTYYIDVAVHSNSGEMYQYHSNIYKIRVINSTLEQGVVKLFHHWEFN